MDKPRTKRFNWRLGLIRGFASGALVLSLASVLGAWILVSKTASLVDEVSAEIDARMVQAEGSLLAVESALGPYDIFASDLSKRVARELRGLVRSLGRLELAKMVVSSETLREIDEVTQGWNQAIASRVPAQEVVHLRDELSDWRERLRELRSRILLCLYGGYAALCIIAGTLSLACLLLLRAYGTRTNHLVEQAELVRPASAASLQEPNRLRL